MLIFMGQIREKGGGKDDKFGRKKRELRHKKRDVKDQVIEGHAVANSQTETMHGLAGFFGGSKWPSASGLTKDPHFSRKGKVSRDRGEQENRKRRHKMKSGLSHIYKGKEELIPRSLSPDNKLIVALGPWEKKEDRKTGSRSR